ncbi:hypothetical protein [Roseospirillum parvum]|uniref:HD domain-containing protein n=1 Tax=Roseospirillum parvum TaxID=83401 RepID=A0A1G7ZPJ3_9PROT|nr:hypothetical protein [Roseospirillum parvum]SDH10598.1 hypothetical protein SAMN05421742_104175 [Roseospirillum parvum]
MDPRQLFSGPIRVGQPRETRRHKGLSRAWIRCPSGRRLDLLDPAPTDVEIGDIALALSRICRWAGMTRTRYGFSVAQHSVLVLDLMDWMLREDGDLRALAAHSKLGVRGWRLAGLLHDGAEAYLGGDLASPAKAHLEADGYKAMEDRLQRAINLRFALPATLPGRLKTLIKAADRASAYAESVLIAGFSRAEADPLFGIRTPLAEGASLDPLPPEAAESLFLQRFAELDPGSRAA